MESMEGMKKLLREMTERGNKKGSRKRYDSYESKEHRRRKYYDKEYDREEDEEDEGYKERYGRSRKGKEGYGYKGKARLFKELDGDDDFDLELFEDLEEKILKAMETLEEECPEMYHMIKFKVYEMANGPHFTEELCEEALECVCEEYKRREAEFDLEEAKQIAKKFGVDFKEFNEHDWCYALNICHCLFEDLCKEDLQMCAKLTYLWLCDRAIPEGKAFYHYMKHLKYKNEEDRD